MANIMSLMKTHTFYTTPKKEGHEVNKC